MATNKKKEDGGWEPVEPGICKFENPGDSIEGVLVSRDQRGDYGSAAYSIETKDGFKLVWGTTVLDDRMRFVNIGDQVRIIFKGIEENKKGQPTKIFEVLKKVPPKTAAVTEENIE